ncbi:MAG: DUF5658 family protein [Desulfovibrionales bacterium]
MRRNSLSVRFWSSAERHLKTLVKGLLLLNVLDLVLTIGWIDKGIAREGNILLRALINVSPFLFILVKITIVTGGALILWKLRAHRLASAGIVLSFGIYCLVLLYHLHMANLYLAHS